MSRLLTIVGGLSVLVFWVIVAMSLNVPLLPDLINGNHPLLQAFFYGFMIVPKSLGQLVLFGVSTLL